MHSWRLIGQNRPDVCLPQPFNYSGLSGSIRVPEIVGMNNFGHNSGPEQSRNESTFCRACVPSFIPDQAELVVSLNAGLPQRGCCFPIATVVYPPFAP